MRGWFIAWSFEPDDLRIKVSSDFTDSRHSQLNMINPPDKILGTRHVTQEGKKLIASCKFIYDFLHGVGAQDWSLLRALIRKLRSDIAEFVVDTPALWNIAYKELSHDKYVIYISIIMAEGFD